MPRMDTAGYAGKPLVARARKLRKEQTPQEAALWDVLRAGRFHGFKFRRQHQIGRYIVDFYCHDLALVVELDGSQHQNAPDRLYDAERDLHLKTLGLSVHRFPNSSSPPEILDSLIKFIREAKAKP